MARVRAEIIIVGDELITGEVMDINSYFIAKRFRDMGVEVTKITTVGDVREEIKEAFLRAMEKNEIILSSGGLGPTLDDHTKEAVADILKKRLVIDDSILLKLKKRFKEQGVAMPGLATKQALVPKGATIIENPVGMAPGIIISINKKSLILLPGTPEELKRMFEDSVIPYIEGKYSLPPIQIAVIRTTNLLETEIQDRLAKIMKKANNVRFSFHPTTTGVDIKMYLEGKRGLKKVIKEVESYLVPNVYAIEEKEIEEVVGEILRRKNMLLSVAESCTGGLVQHRITNVPGSSEYFKGGIVAYSNEIKISECGVKEATLKEHGAVSEEVARELAEGIRERYKADVGISVTGIAGPSGGTKEKPVGLVYMAVSDKEETVVEKRVFKGTRKMIKMQAAVAVLDLLRRFLLEIIE